jgi:hypothetical protein
MGKWIEGFLRSLVPPAGSLSRRVRIGSQLVAAVTMMLMVAVVVGALALRNPGNPTGIAEAREFLSQTIPDRLDVPSGKVLHIRSEIYERFGPKASEIIAGAGIPTEDYVRESWLQVGPADTATISFARVLDASGTVIRETVVRPGEMMRSVDSRTGEVIDTRGADDPIVASVSKITAPKVRALGYEEALNDGRARVVSQTATELTLEISEELPQALKEHEFGPGEWQVPYAGDLEPQSTLQRITIRKDGVITSSDLYVVTGFGDEVLIQSERSTTEILDDMPALPF